MKIWVTGAKGIVGSALLKMCSLYGINAVGTTRLSGDITEKKMLAAQASLIGPTHIVNCAAYTDVDGAERECSQALAINADGAENVAEIAKQIGAHFIHISTDFVFDGMRSDPYSEEAVALPINAYGRSKWEGEKKVLAVLPEACIVRTSWVYGSGGKNFFSGLAEWIKKKEEISIIDDQWGRITYAPDLSDAILSLLNYKGIFHFANEGTTSRFEVAECIFQEMHELNISIACKRILPVSKEKFPQVAPRPTHSILSTEKFTRVTGKRPRGWKESLKEFLSDV